MNVTVCKHYGFFQCLLGRDTWKILIGPQASLQLKFNNEGFNVVCYPGSSTARIGIVRNNENECTSCDSRIGFGAEGYLDHSNACGNVAMWELDNGDKFAKAIGDILAQ